MLSFGQRNLPFPLGLFLFFYSCFLLLFPEGGDLFYSQECTYYRFPLFHTAATSRNKECFSETVSHVLGETLPLHLWLWKAQPAGNLRHSSSTILAPGLGWLGIQLVDPVGKDCSSLWILGHQLVGC